MNVGFHAARRGRSKSATVADLVDRSNLERETLVTPVYQQETARLCGQPGGQARRLT